MSATATVKTIRIADDFSRHPIGRYRTDAKASAEAFRDDLLAPALRDHDRVRVELDGAAGYPSSWLEESFGGLVRTHRLNADDLSALEFAGGAPDDEPRIRQFIREALRANGVPDRTFPKRNKLPSVIAMALTAALLVIIILAVSNARSATTDDGFSPYPAAAPPILEYMTIVGDDLPSAEQLNDLGRAGWTVIAIVPHHDGIHGIQPGEVAIYVSRPDLTAAGLQ